MAKRVSQYDYEKAVKLVRAIDESGIRIDDRFSDINSKAELLVEHGVKNLKRMGTERLNLEEVLDICDGLEKSEQVRISSAFLSNYLAAQRKIKRYEQQKAYGKKKSTESGIDYVDDYFKSKQLYEGFVDINEEGDVVPSSDLE